VRVLLLQRVYSKTIEHLPSLPVFGSQEFISLQSVMFSALFVMHTINVM
jgi:hypothetical protein